MIAYYLRTGVAAPESLGNRFTLTTPLPDLIDELPMGRLHELLSYAMAERTPEEFEGSDFVCKTYLSNSSPTGSMICLSSLTRVVTARALVELVHFITHMDVWRLYIPTAWIPDIRMGLTNSPRIRIKGSCVAVHARARPFTQINQISSLAGIHDMLKLSMDTQFTIRYVCNCLFKRIQSCHKVRHNLSCM